MSKVVASAAGEFLERLRVEASSLNTEDDIDIYVMFFAYDE